MSEELGHYNFTEDNRDPSLAKTERKIQERALSGKKELRLSGPWKELIREENDVEIYRVDSEWMRNNLLAGWNHGGHGYVCEFIPVNEVWVGDTHPSDCECKEVDEKKKISERFFESTVVHETTERALMAEGMIYWRAHQLALEAEKKAGILTNQDAEDYRPLEKK